MAAAKKSRRDVLLEFALTFPDAHIDHPWGETVVKVRKKIFVFFGEDGNEPGGFTVKLDESLDQALAIDGAEPSGYGLGKAGWVNVPLKGRSPAMGVLEDWVEESYRRVAPKTLVRRLDESA